MALKRVWRRMNGTMIRPVYFLILSVGCSNPQANQHVVREQGKVVYLAPAGKNQSPGAPPYGDLWLVDLNTYEQVRLTDDRYWDGPPHFSPDGQRVAFATKREGSQRYLNGRGLGAEEQIAIVDVKNGNLSRIGRSWEKGKAPPFWGSIAWSQDGKSLLCGATGLPPGAIVRISLLTDSISPAALLNDRGQMWHLSSKLMTDSLFAPITWQLRPSPDDRIWAVNFGSLDTGIFLFEPDDSKTYRIIEPQPRVTMGNWTSDGRAIIYVVNGSIYSFSLEHKTSERIAFSILESSWRPHSAMVTKNGKYVVCVENEQKGVNTQYRLLLYDPTVDKWEWLTPFELPVSDWDYVDMGGLPR